ncbi:Gfo/Idh/MocA family oxidoreductase [Sulfitobacter pseudonitzschiae]|uniref:Gfo/Idh/MocA family oxidoreductase n=1 Tax=Pseudosulfitobacter pseudonitzschiae TaxID=1402135 RepID=A0A9Q2RVZ4_9RHOB|nr:Gfo/Idh/MocA family oxidoreductase [Pseudosulfitobacter pseudonitzschiae]MBM2293000.1 Gfo/Idh/MocA family oxidoreductase [Pseudosulfitobacter pseudonitzschiae]MBM2297712.1 Gfo/Idh/MocA family oxidoreductase [Pseudosulfitobacter pseudonitzschiae]MBM2302626.1 Gfo/Idh/MocA family oxidoreductase [Pseudosulfitobacter pseudonitzschiae]MBM2312384.1 Gfo/Idh/MocA family oxidoreductase [Pseudosulfitobacter pseudonitzschiae]MBM2317322.1 Gfo/Idh/MocA family oxidoreductase [Pseudosulfitobacter pseudonit
MKPIRLGMIGGGNDAFIGGVHRIASRIDGRFQLVAGALSSTAEKSKASGAALGLAEDRCYGDFTEMAKREARLKDGVEAVAIVTPNHVHYPAAREFLKRGIHVICDKPLTSTLADAKKLVAAAEKSDALFVLTHNYTGYPMVRQAREMVRQGDLGTLRVVQVEYPQDWLTDAVEADGSKQAEWRTDPARSGAGGCVGDIGTHAYNLARFVTGLQLESLACDLATFVEGRRLDDNVHVMLRFVGGAKGMLWSSQVAPGNENGLKLRVYGDKGGLEWAQEDPNYLWFTPFGAPKRLLTRNGAGATAGNQGASRIPPGHPEGYLEGFANIYNEAADLIVAARDGKTPDHLLPTVQDGLEGVAFIDACVRSSKRDAAWVRL